MKQYLLFFSFLLISNFCSAQVLLSEDFESGSLPAGWVNQSNATDGGWLNGTAPSLTSQFFPIPDNGTRIIATNDDGCGQTCDKSDEYLISAPIDLSGVSSAAVRFDLYYTDQAFEGDQEDARLEVSTDGVNWEFLQDLQGDGAWQKVQASLDDYVGNTTVYIGFKYDDNGGFLYGMAVDNVIVEVPLMLDASLEVVNGADFAVEGEVYNISGTILNNGIETINTIDIQYTINGNAPVIETMENLNLSGFRQMDFQFTDAWVPAAEGDRDITVEILSVNGATDEVADNNTQSFSTIVYGEVIVPNRIEDIMTTIPEVVTKASFADGLNRPTDLDFFPVLGKDELWIINQRTEAIGGSTVTINDATQEFPTMEAKIDGNSWHFMSLPTAIAFSSENFNFGSTAGVQDANHGGGTFTGPSLWSSDPLIYAQPSGGNGSHLDMLHGSPFSMGMAHEIDNAFWVYDDWNKDIVRYDFVDDHGPGADDHSDAMVRRYSDIGIQRDADIPNHMILDKETGWLYFVDNGNDRVMRLDINSGNIASNVPLINEPLAQHVRMGGFTVETIIEGLDRPCGIELFEGNLLVGEYELGIINVYDINNDYEQIGEIPTGDRGLTGIKIGPDGNIYVVNRITNSLLVVSEGTVSSTEDYEAENEMSAFPSPASISVTVTIDGKNLTNDASMTIYDNLGQIVLRQTNKAQSVIDVSEFAEGIYTIEIFQAEKLYKKQISVVR